MEKPRIFPGSSGKQSKLLQALTRGLGDIARVEPWMTSFNPGTTTLERLLELTREVDFAAFVFAQDDWATNSPPAPVEPAPTPGQASPRDNVVCPLSGDNRSARESLAVIARRGGQFTQKCQPHALFVAETAQAGD